MRRREFFGAGAIFSVVSAAAHAAPRKLAAGVQPYVNQAPVQLAKEKGHFLREGLDVELQEFPSSREMLPLLATSRLDAAFLPLTPGLINAVAKGSKIRIVAARDYANPFCNGAGTVFANSKLYPRGIRDVRVLRGKRIAILQRAGLQEFWLDTLLATAGMTSADVQLVFMPVPDALRAAGAGQIEATLAGMGEVYVDSALKKLNITGGISVAGLFPGMQWSYVAFGPTLINGDPSAGSGFLAAYLRAVKDFLGGATPDWMRQYSIARELDFQQVKSRCRKMLSLDGVIDGESLKKFVDWAVQRRYCERALYADALVDNRFLDSARRKG